MASTDRLGSDEDWKLSVNEHRVVVGCRHSQLSWTVLSSAVLNGGLQHFSSQQRLQVLNAKVPADYDGLNPEPKEWLRQLARKEEECRVNDTDSDDNQGPCTTPSSTVGLLTAASMKTLRVATETATGTCGQTVTVDAIVTAGISNARVAGADADVFYFVLPDENKDKNEGEDATKKEFGTINTIILINTPLDESCALLEAYAVAIEAKCRAATDMGIQCAKHPEQVATGTGTDCTVLVTPAASSAGKSIAYSQKHTLVGELIGQAVYQATKEAIETNLHKFYEGYPYPTLWYRGRVYKLQLLQAMKEGHRPLVPSQPMKPIPTPSGWVLGVGLVGLTVALALHRLSAKDLLYRSAAADNLDCPSRRLRNHDITRPSMSVLLAVLCGDRFLGSLMMPLSVHPVVLVGKVITSLLRLIPEPFFEITKPFAGFVSGVLLWGATVLVSTGTAWLVLVSVPWLASAMSPDDHDTCPSNLGWQAFYLPVLSWLLHVFLVRGSLSLQLLCNVALQMAHFLERGQLKKGRDQLSWLCSRDPSALRADELAGATLESLSENLSDSVVSPLFYYVLFGPLGSFAFRVMNTLDSRVGYRGRCEYVGKWSARCDDILNLLPARLTSLLLVLAAAGLEVGASGSRNPSDLIQRGLRVAWRDAFQCDSPNAGWPMATFAGILDVKLEKRGQYALNGASGKAPQHHDIRRGHRIAEFAGMLAFLMAMMMSALSM